MALTYNKIATVTVPSSQPTIDFTSIPNTYTHLLIKLSLDGAGYNATTGTVTFNGSTSGYYFQRLTKDGNTTSATQTTGTNAAGISMEMGSGTNSTSNAFGPNQIFIANYASANVKMAAIEFGTESNSNDKWVGFCSAWWTGSAAINQVTITGSSNWTTGSTAVLYGITQA